MTNTYNLLNRIFEPEHIGYLGHAAYLDRRGKQGWKRIHVEMSVGVHFPYLYLRPDPAAYHLPGNDIGMVLAFRNQDFVTFLEKGRGETRRDKVEGSRGTRSENYFGRTPGAYERRDGSPRLLVFFGSDSGSIMDGPVKVGSVLRRRFGPLVYHALRTQRGRRVVEIDERLAVDCLRQLRKKFPELLYIHTPINFTRLQSCKITNNSRILFRLNS